MPQRWETAELPPSGALLYQCIGSGWHSIEYHDPEDLQWMRGQPGTHNPEDGFYCDLCIANAERGARKGVRPSLVLGPTLEEELKRRKG